MAMDAMINGVSNDYENQVKTLEPVKSASDTGDTARTKEMEYSIENVDNKLQNGEEENALTGKEKEPSKSTIDSAISGINAQMRMNRTRCAYAYDEDTKRITIKVYDEVTDELIREVPPERSLEVLKKIWEIAGIIIDQKL